MGSDIVQGKRSLPIVHALEQAGAGTAAGDQLRRALRDRDVATVMAVLDAGGTRTFVEQAVDEHTRAAIQALDDARTSSPYGDALRAIAEFALGRES